jgi:hypothetical protein
MWSLYYRLLPAKNEILITDNVIICWLKNCGFCVKHKKNCYIKQRYVRPLSVSKIIFSVQECNATIFLRNPITNSWTKNFNLIRKLNANKLNIRGEGGGGGGPWTNFFGGKDSLGCQIKLREMVRKFDTYFLMAHKGFSPLGRALLFPNVHLPFPRFRTPFRQYYFNEYKRMFSINFDSDKNFTD